MMETDKRADKGAATIHDYDVVVAGGGTAGMVAAIASARSGARTLLLERNNCLGGTMTSGLIIQFGGGGYRFMRGIQKEILDDLIKSGDATDLREPNVNFPFDPEALKDLALAKVADSGADLLLYTSVVGVLKDGGSLRGIEIENKSGRFTIRARVIIDATGDADVAAFAGAPFLNVPIGCLLGAKVGNIDVAPLLEYMKAHPEQVCENDCSKPLIRFAGFFDLVEQAIAGGDLESDMMKVPEYLLAVEGTQEGARRYLRVDGVFPDKGTAMIGYGANVYCDGTDAFSLTRAEIAARRRNKALLNFLRKYIPGFGQSYIIHTGSNLAVFGSRRIVGDYTLTSDDICGGRRFDDAVVNAHANLDHRTLHIKSIEFDIPFRCLLPLGVDNIMAVGRCISTSRDAKIPGINNVICMQMGQVAGIVAAMSAKEQIPPRGLPVRSIQEMLGSAHLLGRFA